MDRYFFTGKSEEVLADWPDNCVGSVVTDPPYGWAFMGKNWDKALPPQECWEQVYRVLKPGGYMCVFGAPRMYHRLAVSIEDAGFILKDCLMHIFGSGFPKSQNVSKMIDKMHGAEREVIGSKLGQPGYSTKENDSDSHNRSAYGKYTDAEKKCQITASTTDDARKWEGWGSALKPAYEPILLCQKPIEKGLTIAKNVLKWGVGAINIDGCRIGGEFLSAGGNNFDAWRSGENRDDRPEQHGQSSSSIKPGRWPANLLLECTCENPVVSYEKGYVINKWDDGAKPFGDGAGHPYSGTEMPGGAILIHSDPSCPCYGIDEQSGVSKSTGGHTIKRKGYGTFGGGTQEIIKENPGLGDTGGASRYFYQAKANKKEKNAGCDELYWDITSDPPVLIDNRTYDSLELNEKKKGNIHPTVKPMALLGYLLRLVTPREQPCLDPFVGSGSTVCAAAIENLKCIGIDMDSSFVALAQARLNHWENKE